jgi:hypothetical protein
MRLSLFHILSWLALAAFSSGLLIPLNETLGGLLPPLKPVLELVGQIGNRMCPKQMRLFDLFQCLRCPLFTNSKPLLLTLTQSTTHHPTAPEHAHLFHLLNCSLEPPPSFLWTPNPSPQCAAINQGELRCCYATLAGDLPLVQWLAGIYGYELNPDDVNGVYCE